MNIPFEDRFEAGQQLAHLLGHHAGSPEVMVLALPRGGVPVGYEVARLLPCPLDVFMVRKLGLPGHEELAMGAIATGGIRILNQRVVRQSGVSPAAIEVAAERETRELERREAAYHTDRPSLHVEDQTVILVDDGIATGSTMQAAVSAVRHLDPRCIVVATPVASIEAVEMLRKQVNEVIAVMMPEDFTAVGEWYRDFTQTSDEEVRGLLESAAEIQHHPV